MELNQVSAMTPNEQEVPTSLKSVIKQFEEVFSLQQGLPPICSNEPKITLKEGSSPISVRPYRYPYFRKLDIEKLVAEMLEAGIIQVSSSSFSSPVLLVKKNEKGRGAFVLIIASSTKLRC